MPGEMRAAVERKGKREINAAFPKEEKQKEIKD